MKRNLYVALCAIVLNIVVCSTVAQAFSVIVTSTNVTCNNANNGSAAANVQAAGSYTYAWSNGATTSSIVGLSPGTYSVTVTKSNGQTVIKSVTITQPAKLKTKVKATKSCSSACAGTAEVTEITGGTAPYTVLWSNGGTALLQTGLCSGNYSATVTDNNGCTASASTTVFSNVVTITTVSSMVMCNGACNGLVSTNVSGTAPYNYAWSNGMTTASINGLCPGNYTLTVTDAAGCSAASTATVTQPTQLLSTISWGSVTCFGSCNGSATVTAIGGTPPYLYNWSNGATTASVAGLCAGNYAATITDANGCTNALVATITQPTQMIVTVTTTNATSGCNGQAAVTVAGGVAPFSFIWSNGSTSSSISGLCAGNYVVTVTGGNGCTASSVGTVNPANLILTWTYTSILCNGSCSGTATVTASGTPPYTYLWSTGATTTTIAGLCAGTYSVTATDANSTTGSATLTINQPAPLTINLFAISPVPGQCNGFISPTVSGGTAPYTYHWNTGANASSIAGLCAGTYTVTVTDANGCTISQTTTLGGSPLTLAVTWTNITCFGSCNGVATTSISGGVSPYSIQWSNGATTSTISGLCAGNYVVTVTDDAGSTVSAVATIVQPTAILLTTTSVAATSGCNGQITATAAGGAAPYTFSLGGVPGGSTFSNLCPGTYTIIVTDANSCTASMTTTVSGFTPMSVAIVTTNVTCAGACNGTASPAVTGGLSPYSFDWSNGAHTPGISSLCPGTYSLTVTASDGTTASATGVITTPTAMAISITPSLATCSSTCSGSTAVAVTGGVAPYNFNWSNGATSSSLSSLCSGTYVVTVSDANGCSVAGITTVTILTSPAIALTSTSSCIAACTGTITTSVSGSGNIFQWSDGATTQSRGGLCTGIYSVTVTNSSGCTNSASVSVGVGCREEEIVNHTDNNAITVFPNPFSTSTQLQFTIPNDDHVTIDVYSVSGVRLTHAFDGFVKANETNTISLNSKMLPQGVYIYKLTTSENIYTGRIVRLEQ